MSDSSNFNNMGEQIRDAVSDALQNGNFQTLNHLVSKTVAATLDEVGIHIPPPGSGAQTDGQQASGRQTDIPLWQQALGPDFKGGQRAQNRQSQTQSQNSARQNTARQQNVAGQSVAGQNVAGQNTAGQYNTGQQSQYRQSQTQSQNSARQYNTGQQNARQHSSQQNTARQHSSRQNVAGQNVAGQNVAGQNTAGQYNTGQQSQYRQYNTGQQSQYRQYNTGQQSQYRQAGTGYPQTRTDGTPDRRANPASVSIKQVGRVSSILYRVFGGIGTGITSLAITGLIANFEADFSEWVIVLFFFLFFLGMLQLGILQKRRLQRAKRYVSLCDYRMFGQVSDLAMGTGRSRKYVARDLQRMLNAGIFPEGHLDEQRTCLMLNDAVFRQYLVAENNRRRRESEAQTARAENTDARSGQTQPNGAQAQTEAAGRGDTENTELETIIAEGMACVRRLRDLNDRIAGEVISAKLFRLENLLKDIFENIREHPDQMHRIHRLMDYYLPTTLRLVEAYADFDQVSAPGDEIIRAKAEIENTLDTINQAFAELLNNLFQAAVFDATTDAQVLKTMLAREGLTKEMEFAAHRQQGGISDEQ